LARYCGISTLIGVDKHFQQCDYDSSCRQSIDEGFASRNIMVKHWGLIPRRFWASSWKRRNDWKGHRISFTFMLAMLIGAASIYYFTNQLAAYRGWSAFDPKIFLDDSIPFVYWMMIPYCTLYLYYPAAAWFGIKGDKMMRENLIFHQMLITSCWFVFAVFLILPVEIDLRGDMEIPKSLFWQVQFDFMHTVDEPWNAWPSLHIVQSLLIVLVIRRWFPSQTIIHSVLHALLWFAWISLVLSTMMVKQHFVWDVVTGIIYALVCWKYWFKPTLDIAGSDEGEKIFSNVFDS